MRIIPVIDLKDGLVVRGIAGRRAEYRPVVSQLALSAEPLAVAQSFRDALGCTELYLADLDAIAGASPAWQIYRQLHELGLQLWVDAGVRTVERASALADAGVARVVVGLETIAGPNELERTLEALPAARVVFSLDLRDGVPLGSREAWENADASAIARRVCRIGVRTMILLDLARVGLGTGLGTEPLCRQLRHERPDLELVLGGGVSGPADLSVLASCGASAVLVASALHDGRITSLASGVA